MLSTRWVHAHTGSVPVSPARVREALRDTQRRLCEAMWYGENPSDAIVESEKRKRSALHVISLYGVDFLPVDLLPVAEIEARARVVTQEGFWLALL